MKKPNIKQKKQLELGIIIFAGLLSLLFWNSFLIFPIKIFVVLMHEIFHGLAAVFTGGKIVSIEVSSNLGGECITQNGLPFIIASAGYLGSLITGASLFISGYNKKVSLWVCTIIAAILLLFATNYMIGTEGIIAALLYSALMYISPRFFNKTVHLYLMKILGLVSCLYVIVDMKEDLLTMGYRLTDAQMISDTVGGPALLWGLIWISISIFVLYLLFKHSYKKGMKS